MNYNLNTERESLINKLAAVNKRGDKVLVAKTIKKALKKSRITKQATPPQYVQVEKVIMAIMGINANYQEEIKQALRQEGKQDNFEAQGTYCHGIETSNEGLLGKLKSMFQSIGVLDKETSKLIYQHNTDEERFYLRMYPTLAQNYESVTAYFDANGDIIPPEVWEQIEQEYFALKTINPDSQGGLKEKIIVLNYGLENVLYLGNADLNNPVLNKLTENVLVKLGIR